MSISFLESINSITVLRVKTLPRNSVLGAANRTPVFTEGTPFPSAQNSSALPTYKKRDFFSSLTVLSGAKTPSPPNTVTLPLQVGEHRQLLKNLPPNSIHTLQSELKNIFLKRISRKSE
ncbi:hypothetical protein TNCV_3586361 [Trichonephila clavipes]|nr:hypothetical protein TNCV_3586361 [Trichonephila clavipes]